MLRYFERMLVGKMLGLSTLCATGLVCDGYERVFENFSQKCRAVRLKRKVRSCPNSIS